MGYNADKRKEKQGKRTESFYEEYRGTATVTLSYIAWT